MGLFTQSYSTSQMYNTVLEESTLQFYFCIVNPLYVWIKNAFDGQFLIALSNLKYAWSFYSYKPDDLYSMDLCFK